MFGNFSIACLEFVKNFEQRTFYFGSTEVKCVLACQAFTENLPNIETDVSMQNNQLMTKSYVELKECTPQNDDRWALP